MALNRSAPLFPSILSESASFATEQPAYFGDLNLDQFVASISARRTDYPIDGYFRAPLPEKTSIGYRQDVFRDFEQRTVEEAVTAFCEAMQSMRRCLQHAEDKRGYARPRQRWFLDAVLMYCEAVDGLGDGLGKAVLISEGFQAIRRYVESYRQSEDFRALRAETVAMSETINAITFSLRFHGTRITTRRYDDAPNYSTEVLATFDRFRQEPTYKQERAARDQVERDINHVEAAIVDMAARLFPDELTRLADYCSRRQGFPDPGITAFHAEVQFYLAYLDFIAELRAAGLTFCYPELTSTLDRVYATEAFDLALADRLRRDGATAEVVPNDFSLRHPEHILVVSGPNQGGKTTFARMIGQLHFLASLGCPVPGRKARLLLSDQLFTHFEREESLVNLAGKLEDDLLHVPLILQSATRSSLIIINEIFTSTTLDDAVFLSREVLDKVIALGCLTVMVSFIDELSTIGPATVSMVSTVDPDDATRRTYRIVRRAAEGLAYAAALADKYRLSYPSPPGKNQPMKVHLLYQDRDVDFTIGQVGYPKGWEIQGPPLSGHSEALIQDLELEPILAAMADGDTVLFDIAKRVMMAGLTDPEAICYRQQVLSDCLKNEPIVRRMLVLAASAVDTARRLPGWYTKRPEGLLRRSLEVLDLYVALLRQLRSMVDGHAESFSSPGFSRLFATLQAELDDDYFQLVEAHLKTMRFSNGVPVSAKFGPGLKPSGFVLRTVIDTRLSFKERLGIGPRTEYHWDLPPRDEAGSRALSELNDKALVHVADAVGQSVAHISSFFVMLWIELGFYTACLNLAGLYRRQARPTCFPLPVLSRPRRLRFEGLCDASLALYPGQRVVGNDATADDKDLIVITGANSGGKLTFLRSAGLAQIMMQAGMFVCAKSLTASTASRVFTHFIREEDPTMTSGKLDEELARMSSIADQLTRDSYVLFNESFAATNEREGSEIARQIVCALLDSGIRVCFVTHQYSLASNLYGSSRDRGLFLRADRTADGVRTFKLVEGEPLRTSFGEDLYRRIGGWGNPLRDDRQSLPARDETVTDPAKPATGAYR